MKRDDLLSIGEIAARSGMATSAVRFYESEGMISSTRTSSGQRRFARHTLRRIAFIRAAQRVGLPLRDAADALATLPPDRAPTKAEWARLSRSWRGRLDARIADLQALRDDLSSCIGCGCLSIIACRLYNPDDDVRKHGPGPRFLLGDQRA